MKKQILIMLLACATSVFFACSGDHSDKTVRDTAKNKHDDVPSNIDTSKASRGSGNVDNSGSGGTDIKDTIQKAKPDTIRK
jgi:hypothetical protein